jgi:solute:Na+ symporter, SSS family
MLAANSTDYAVIVCYILLMIGVGVYVMRFNKTASEYFRGGSRIPWLVAGLSSFMSGFSAWTFTGGAGVAYGSGIAIIGLYIGNGLSFLLGYYIFASRWRRTRISTVMEYLSDRFDPTTHQLFSWATIIFQLFTSATMLYGLSLFVSTACHFSVKTTILITGGVILSYSVLGGLWAVVVADFLQASILLPFCIVLAAASLVHVGGISGLIHSLPPQMKTIPLHGEFGWIYLVCWAVMVSFGYNTSAMAQRYFSVEDERAAKRVALLCCGLFFLGAFLWFIPPMAMRIIYPNLHAIWPHLANPNEASYVAASLTFLPHGLIGVMLAAMFSATMASLSANFNLKSAILSKDIYQTLFRPRAGERELLVIGAIMTLLIGGATTALAAVMAARGESIFGVMMTFNTLISLSYGPPALLGLVFRRTPRWSGMATFVTGLTLGILGDFVFHWTFIQQIVFVVPPAFAVFFLSMLFDREESAGRASLFKRLDTPVDPAEIKDVPDFSRPVFRFLSRAVACIGFGSLLLLIPNPPAARITILSFSAITLTVAASLRFVPGSRSSRAALTAAPVVQHKS